MMYPSYNIMNLTAEECALVMDNCFANLFVTDSTGKIMYVNQFSSEILGLPTEKLLGMTVYDLQREGYISHSFTDDVLRTKKQVTGSYYNKDGKEVASVCTPVFNPDGLLRMVVTYSQEIGNLGALMEEIRRQREKIQNYQEAIDYLDVSQSFGSEMVARDPITLRVLELLKKIAPTDSTIMLYGESGVGKEVMAKYIRQQSIRDRDTFFPINCAAIPADLIESELFGYERGAFTGASREGKRGLFELADKGTVFMDEIGELSLSAQSKLLRVLESGEYQRIGGEKIRKTDVRIIGATNRDLKKMVEEKTFRSDLYYRLNVFPVQIPPLRERPLDLEGLAEFFLAQYNRKHRQNKKIPYPMMKMMQEYCWPGNIRELRNFIERFVITGEIAQMTEIKIDGLPGHENWIEPYRDMQLKEFVAVQERKYIRAVLDECGGNITEAAKKLGVHRSALYRKLK